MQTETYRDLQGLAEADRDSQKDPCSCIDMHRKLGRQRQTERGRDRQRQTETGRDRQRQT